MNLRDKKPRNQKDSVSKNNEAEAHGILNPLEVKEYEKGRVKKGHRFGKKWFPENKGE